MNALLLTALLSAAAGAPSAGTAAPPAGTAANDGGLRNPEQEDRLAARVRKRRAPGKVAVPSAGGLLPLDLDALAKERESTLASFRDPHASPLAAVARHDFAGDR